MAGPLLFDRVRERTATTGTGSLALSGAVQGYQSFAVVGNGNSCYYAVSDLLGNWEVGIGAYTAATTTLSRDTVLASSSGGAKVDFPAGTKNVWLDAAAAFFTAAAGHKAAQDAIAGLLQCDGAGNYTAVADASANWNTAYSWGNHAAAGYPSYLSSRFAGAATDFLTALAYLSPPWYGLAISSGAQAQTTSYVTANHPGVIQFSSSTTANSGWRYCIDSTAFVLAGGEETEFIFQTPASIDAGTTIYMGFHDTGAVTAPTDGVWLNIAGATLDGRAKNNAGPTITGTNYTLSAGTWYRAKIVLNSDATRADFYLYSEAGTQLWTDNVQANIPTDAGRNTGHGVVATNSGTTSVALIMMDFMSFKIPRTLTR